MIKKVVVPLAGFGTRMFPATLGVSKSLLPVLNKPVVEYIVEECVNAGLEEIIFIVAPNQHQVQDYLYVEQNDVAMKNPNHPEVLRLKELVSKIKITYAVQTSMRGLGDAVRTARPYVDEDEDFGVILGDNPILGEDDNYGMKQLCNAYAKNPGYYIGLMKVETKDTPKYGIVAADAIDESSTDPNGVQFKLTGMIEKPKSNPPSNYAAMGRYILNGKIFNYIDFAEQVASGEIQLTSGIERAIVEDTVYGIVLNGTCHDTGNKEGMLRAQIDYAYHSDLKETLLMLIKDLK